MTEISDSELRRQFAKMREAERAGVPGFADVLERARRAAPRARVRPLHVALAAGALTVAVVAVVVARGGPDGSDLPSIVAWSAPSDVLLPRTTLTEFGPLTPLGESVLDAFIR